MSGLLTAKTTFICPSSPNLNSSMLTKCLMKYSFSTAQFYILFQLIPMHRTTPYFDKTLVHEIFRGFAYYSHHLEDFLKEFLKCEIVKSINFCKYSRRQSPERS